MSKLQYQCAMSLDGFIAGAGGDMSWLASPTGEPEPETTNPLVAQVGAVLSGNRTYRGDDPNAGTDREGAYDGQYTGPTFVLTHHPPVTSEPGVTFVEDLDTAISSPSRPPARSSSASSAPTSPASASRSARSTRSSSTSRRCCSATASASSTAPAAPSSDSRSCTPTASPSSAGSSP